jgi:hypothetical protein
LRKFTIALLIAIAPGVTWTSTPADAATWRARECRFQTLDGRKGWSTWEVQRTIRCAATRFGIDVQMALFVADHESGFQARTGYDSYCGVYQHSRSAFPYRLDGARARWPKLSWYGRPCENARSNILAAFDLVKDSGGWEAHWCRWTAYC